MKYIIILGDGMADYSIASLGNKTPLQAAHTPHMDRIAREGRCGLLHTISDPTLPPGSETANLSVLGYDPHKVLQGRGVLEAAAMGVNIGPDQIGMRCNLICLEHGRIKNHSAGHISTGEADELIQSLDRAFGSADLNFHTGVSYRHLLVARGMSPEIECRQPHDHPGQEVAGLMIKPLRNASDPAAAQQAADQLNALIEHSWHLLETHPVNRSRIARGLDPANSIWPWSPGRRPQMWTFKDRFNISGAAISAVDLIRGIGVYAGLEVIDVDGATGLWDTNYEGKAQAALDALQRHDFVFVHVEGPDEAGHEGSIEQKLKAIEYLDARLIGPLLEGVERKGWPAVVAVLPDHPTPVERRVHTREPVPFAIMAPEWPADGVQTYDEAACRLGSFGELKGDAFIRAIFGQ